MNKQLWHYATILLLIISAIAAPSPLAGQYYNPQDDPCAPNPGGEEFGAIFNQINAAQRAQACQQARDAAVRQRQAHEFAAQARTAEAERIAAQAQADRDARSRAIATARAAAEASPDNI